MFVKDESDRMGLPAFKILGASWATHQVLSRRPAGAQLLLAAANPRELGLPQVR